MLAKKATSENPATPDALAGKRVLVIDDVPEFLRFSARILRPFCSVSVCSSPVRAVRMAGRVHFDLILTTLVMRELDGFDVIRRIRGNGVGSPIIMITGHGDENTSVEAIRLGVSDYLTAPVNPDELLGRIRRVLAGERTQQLEGAGPRPKVVTRNAQMRALLNLASRAANSDSRVLILGETGTGKELIARVLHESSPRAGEPFVQVNCAAIPSELLESEFFGHERGSFTGATERRTGRFEEAHRGTLFLDEIGELNIALQSKLLRVLESGDFNRVGGSLPLHSDARVIAATNRDLEAEARAGRFRGDLFYRLNVVALPIPPLRDRPEDIPLLVDHFAERFAPPGTRPIQFPVEIMRTLGGYSWPGNVRELQHMVERISVLYPGRTVSPELLPAPLLAGTPREMPENWFDYRLPYKQALLDFQRRYFEKIISEAGGNLAEGARIADMDRSHFFRKAQKLGLLEK